MKPKALNFLEIENVLRSDSSLHPTVENPVPVSSQGVSSSHCPLPASCTSRMIAFHWRLFLAASLAIRNHSASQTSLFIFMGLRMELRSALTRSGQVHFMPPLGRFQPDPFKNSMAEFGRVVGSWRST